MEKEDAPIVTDEELHPYALLNLGDDVPIDLCLVCGEGTEVHRIGSCTIHLTDDISVELAGVVSVFCTSCSSVGIQTSEGGDDLFADIYNLAAKTIASKPGPLTSREVHALRLCLLWGEPAAEDWGGLSEEIFGIHMEVDGERLLLVKTDRANHKKGML